MKKILFFNLFNLFKSSLIFCATTFLCITHLASAEDTFSVTPFAFSSAGGTMSAGPYTCTTSIGTVEGSATSKNGNLKITGGFICVAPYVYQPCDADVDGSGTVDTGDVSILLLFWGPTIPLFKFADLDRNGFIDSADVSLVLLDFDQSCSSGLVGPSIEIEFVEPKQPVEIEPLTHSRNSK